MEHVFWGIAGKLAGRAGPNMAPWQPDALFEAGFRGVLTVNHGVDVLPHALRAAGLAHRRVRFPGGIPPHPDACDVALEALPDAYAFYREVRCDGPLLVHCSFGKDRTGLFIAYVLMRDEGLDVNAAIARLRAVRPIALSATGWEDLARRVLPHAVALS